MLAFNVEFESTKSALCYQTYMDDIFKELLKHLSSVSRQFPPNFQFLNWDICGCKNLNLGMDHYFTMFFFSNFLYFYKKCTFGLLFIEGKFVNVTVDIYYRSTHNGLQKVCHNRCNLDGTH